MNTSNTDGDSEKIPESRLRELSDMRKVFVHATGVVSDRITAALRESGRLEIVKTPKEAEFAVTYDAWPIYFYPTPEDVLTPRSPTSTTDLLNRRHTGGTLIATVRDPAMHAPRIVWRGQQSDESSIRAADKLIERFISEFKESDILLPMDFLGVESKRVQWDLERRSRYLINQGIPQAQAMPTPDIWTTSLPPSLSGPTPFPTPRPEVIDKLRNRIPPASRPLATPVPIVRPADQLPVYLPQPTSTQQASVLDQTPVFGKEDPYLKFLASDVFEANPYRRLNTVGQFSEVLGKRKVFLNVTGQAREKITARLREYGRLEIGFTAQDAEFALNYFNSIDSAKGGTLIVTIRDPAERLPRIIWRNSDAKNSDAFDKLIKRFISDLKKSRGREVNPRVIAVKICQYTCALQPARPFELARCFLR